MAQCFPHFIALCWRRGEWDDDDLSFARRLFLRVATLDNPSALPPDVHIYTRSKLDWVVLPKGARAFDEYYDMEKEWPRESLARRDTLLGRAG